MIKRRPLRDFWREAGTAKKILSFIVLLSAAAVPSYAGFTYVFGTPPWPNVDRLESLEQWAGGEIDRKQINLQFEIGKLDEKCKRACSDYERKALENYRKDWKENEDRLKRIGDKK